MRATCQLYNGRRALRETMVETVRQFSFRVLCALRWDFGQSPPPARTSAGVSRC